MDASKIGKNLPCPEDNFRSKSGSAQKTDYSKGQGKNGSVAAKRSGDKCLPVVKPRG